MGLILIDIKVGIITTTQYITQGQHIGISLYLIFADATATILHSFWTNILLSYTVFPMWHNIQSPRDSITPFNHQFCKTDEKMTLFFRQKKVSCRELSFQVVLHFFPTEWYLIKGLQVLRIPLAPPTLQCYCTIPLGEKRLADKAS